MRGRVSGSDSSGVLSSPAGWGGRGRSAPSRKRKGKKMKENRIKMHTYFKDMQTGEIVGEGELTPARARAIVKAYKVAGLFVEAVA